MVKAKNPALEQRRKRQLMDTCYRLLVERSHRDVTLAAVAREAGVSKGMLTYYYESKEQLVVETIADFLEQQEQLLLAIANNDTLAAHERLRMIIHAALPDHEEIERQIRFQIEVWSFCKGRPEMTELVRGSYQRFRRQCAQLMERGVEEGYVTTEEVGWINLLLHALLDGLSMQLAIDSSLDVIEVRERLVGLIDRLLGAHR